VQPSLQQVTTTTTDVSVAQKNNPFFRPYCKLFSTILDHHRPQAIVCCCCLLENDFALAFVVGGVFIFGGQVSCMIENGW